MLQLFSSDLFADAGSVNGTETNVVDAFVDSGADVVCIRFVVNGHEIFAY